MWGGQGIRGTSGDKWGDMGDMAHGGACGEIWRDMGWHWDMG